MVAYDEDDDNALELASNAVARLVAAGKLDEAERAAHRLVEDFPEVHDGYDRLGMVHEARGNKKAAVECYRKAAAFIRDNDGSPELEQVYLDLVRRLGSPGS